MPRWTPSSSLPSHLQTTGPSGCVPLHCGSLAPERVTYKKKMQKTQQNCCKWLSSTARSCWDAALSCTVQRSGCRSSTLQQPRGPNNGQGEHPTCRLSQGWQAMSQAFCQPHSSDLEATRWFRVKTKIMVLHFRHNGETCVGLMRLLWTKQL